MRPLGVKEKNARRCQKSGVCWQDGTESGPEEMALPVDAIAVTDLPWLAIAAPGRAEFFTAFGGHSAGGRRVRGADLVALAFAAVVLGGRRVCGRLLPAVGRAPDRGERRGRTDPDQAAAGAADGLDRAAVPAEVGLKKSDRGGDGPRRGPPPRGAPPLP